jgi:replicative DNA helicase
MDRDLSGWKKDRHWVFAAETHWGKSSHAIACADENIKRGKRVLIVSTEDAEDIYGDRLMMRRARVDPYRLEDGTLTPDELSRIAAVANKGEDIPVYLKAIGRPIEWACRKVKQIVPMEGIDLVLWDYLGAFQKEKKVAGENNSEWGAYTYIARCIADTVKGSSFKVASILYGQMTPDPKHVVPLITDIRGAKDVVNAADGVAMGFTPTTKVERDEDGQRVTVAEIGTRCIVVHKKKSGPGPSGRIYPMLWDKAHRSFDVTRGPDGDRYGFVDDLLTGTGGSDGYTFDAFEDAS